MRKWVKWCINHRLKWIVYLVLLLSLPLVIAVGIWYGCKELLGEFARDIKSVHRAQPQQKDIQ